MRRFSRKDERGTVVVIVVAVTTLLTAIGLFAVRNIGQIDQAVGYSRQGAQAAAFGELGATAAIAEVANNADGALKAINTKDASRRPLPCPVANGPFVTYEYATCWAIDNSTFETTTAPFSGETLTEPAIAGTETGSFGPLANVTGVIKAELTEAHDVEKPTAGNTPPTDVTLTVVASVNPITASSDGCGDGVPTVSIKKVLRSHILIPKTVAPQSTPRL